MFEFQEIIKVNNNIDVPYEEEVIAEYSEHAGGENDDSNASNDTLDIDLSSESDATSDNDAPPEESFEKSLIVWGLKSNISQKHMTKLLIILNRHLPKANIPTSYKLLLKKSHIDENNALPPNFMVIHPTPIETETNTAQDLSQPANEQHHDDINSLSLRNSELNSSGIKKI